MAKTSIIPGQAAQAPTVSDQQVANIPANGVVPQDRFNYDDGSRDRIIPRLGLVNATGPLAKKFRADYGKFVYDNRLVLGAEVQIIGLKLSKFYVACRENGIDLKFEDEKKTFATANAAHQAGYALDFDSNFSNKAEEAANLLVLVSGPQDDVSGDFFIKAGGLYFAPAAMTVRRGGYRATYRPLFTQESKAEMRGAKLWQSIWNLGTEEVASTKNDNVWVEPRATIKSRVSDEDLVAMEKILASYITLPTAKE